jgi:nucleoside-diphosphate-sugar epimerase
MRTLVTGAAGMIGAHIVRALVGAGNEVRCLVRQTSRRDLLDGLPVTCVVVDLLDAGNDLDAACAGCDMVFHTAAHYAYGVSSAELHRTWSVPKHCYVPALVRRSQRGGDLVIGGVRLP